MAKENKNVEALGDEKLEKASGGMINPNLRRDTPYWLNKPPVNIHPNPMMLTGRRRKSDLSKIDWSKFKNAQEGK